MQSLVVPLVGTWIEIGMWTSGAGWTPSCPSWARGLKYASGGPHHGRNRVVPLVGTWIEIVKIYPHEKIRVSCPSWARGLKLARRV